MNELIRWGLEIVRWIQTFRNPLLDQFFLTINFLGDEEFYLLFFPLIFWCFHKAIGYRLAFLFLVSAWTNAFFKNVFAAPRPHDVDPKLYAPIKTTGYGIPSGHTQGTVVTWGNLATQLKTRAWWTLAILIPLFVGIGRMYLGDHFPQDVLAGAGLGVLLVVGYALVQPRLGESGHVQSRLTKPRPRLSLRGAVFATKQSPIAVWRLLRSARNDTGGADFAQALKHQGQVLVTPRPL
jgi:membrane-associated phospholipid phosphatase